MSIITQYAVGVYRAAERHLLVMNDQMPSGASPLIIAHHGRGADATQMGPLYYNGIFPHVEALAEAGYTVMSIDGGPTLTAWANEDTLATDYAAAIAWAQDLVTQGGNGQLYPRCKAGKIGLYGWSMGGLTSLMYHVRNKATIAGTFVEAPVIDLQKQYDDNPSSQAEMTTAYGGNFATGIAAQGGHNPYARMAEYAGGPPIVIRGSSDDPTASYQRMQAFVAAVPEATLLSKSGLGHFPFVGQDPATIVEFFRKVLPV